MNKIQLIPMVFKKINYDLPIYIYGAGITASKVYSYLSSFEVNISGFVVDKRNIESLCDLAVLDFKILEEGPVNLVLGFVPTNETVDEISENVTAKFKSINFITYDFSFLSFGLFGEQYFESQEFRFVMDLLEDSCSVETLIGYVKSRNTGNYRFCEQFYDPNQYFSNNIISLNKNETFVDCGVYDGQTIKEFILRNNNSFEYVYGFEPDITNYKKSINNLKFIPSEKIELYNLGSWSKKEILRFNSISERVSEIDPNGSFEIKVDSIDNLIKDRPVSFIKMDVEGAELNSLKGAENTIKLNKPKLAICLYHKPEDIFEIISFIDKLGLSYKFYIRLHTRYSQELVLYCV